MRVWGPRNSPGRWYVVKALKMILAHLLINYDFKLADSRSPRSFTWTTALVPRFGTKLLVRRRKDEE